jgi:HD-GYP domain-containing protein (c-di-GMP phosphodiesterase class II)
MNGTGFPRGLTRDQLSIPARMMGVADIFEALTAKERPYKPPMPLSQAFSILRRMRDDEHIDHEVYHLFLTSGCWRQYAEKHLSDVQRDVGDVAEYL